MKKPKKIKNETALLKKAIEIGEKYAMNRGYNGFSATNASKEKIAEENAERLFKEDESYGSYESDYDYCVNG